MRTYLAKIRIPAELKNQSTGYMGEKIFELWFNSNYHGEGLFKQSADREYDKIDFADEKGYTYQVKCTKCKTYTFNCDLEDVLEHLRAELYVFIQISDKYAYIEPIYKLDEVLGKLKRSFKSEKQCYIYAKDLMQNKLLL